MKKEYYWIIGVLIIVFLLIIFINGYVKPQSHLVSSLGIPMTCSDYPINITEKTCEEENVRIVFNFSCSDTEKYKPIQVRREDNEYSKDFISFEPFENITFTDNCTKPSQYSLQWSCSYYINTGKFSLEQNIPTRVNCKKYGYQGFSPTFYVKMKNWEKGISNSATSIKEIIDNKENYFSKNVTVSGIIISCESCNENDNCGMVTSPAWNVEIWYIDDGTGYLGVIAPIGSSYELDNKTGFTRRKPDAIWETGDKITITGILVDKAH